jgi:hypothetical protein
VKWHLLSEFWALVLLGGSLLTIFMIVRGWFGGHANFSALLAGVAIAAIGLVRVARKEQ